MAKLDLASAISNHVDRLIDAAVAVERMRCARIVMKAQHDGRLHDVDKILREIERPVDRAD